MRKGSGFRVPATAGRQDPGFRRGGARLIVLVSIAVLFAAAIGWWWMRSPIKGTTPSNNVKAPADVWFEELAAAAGLRFTHVAALERRYWFPEIMGGGVCLFDYDADGDLDVYFVQSGDLAASGSRPANQLFRNRGDGTFDDVTAAAGVGDTGYGMGCACGDYDGDGKIDLYVTNVGPNVLYHNNGDGTFSDVTTAAGVGDPAWGASAAFLDYDGDGDLDLYVVNYVNWSAQHELRCSTGGGEQDYCSPNNYNAPAPDVLYRNDGNGRFTDVSAAAGLRKAFGNGLGVVWGDFDLDGRVDVFVANDGMPNQLWINHDDGTFTDEALLMGCAVNRNGAAEAGMGIHAADIDNDGDLDVFITHLHDEANILYAYRDGFFTDATIQTGLAAPSLAFTGFGTGFADFDDDGALDLYVANGRVLRWGPAIDANDPYAEPNQLFRGHDAGRFEEVMPRGGTARELIGNSRAAAFGDLDNDGGIDLVVVNNGGRAYLLRNLVGPRGHWAMFRVLNRHGADALGASVRISAAGKVQRRSVQVAYSFCASNDPRVHFGLGPASQVDEVTVRWPDGRQESFGPFPAGHIHELREATGR